MKSLFFDRQGNPIADVLAWARLVEDPEYKRVDYTDLEDGTFLSTVWIGIDHSYGTTLGYDTYEPMIFETMRFDKAISHGTIPSVITGRQSITYPFHTSRDFPFGGVTIDHVRYSTEDEARLGHAAIVAEIKKVDA